MGKDHLLRDISRAIIEASKEFPELSNVKPSRRTGLVATAMGLYLMSGPIGKKFEDILHEALPEELKDRLHRGDIDQLEWPLVTTKDELTAEAWARFFTPVFGAEKKVIKYEDLADRFGEGRYFKWEETRSHVPFLKVRSTGEFGRKQGLDRYGADAGVTQKESIYKVTLVGRQRLFTPLPRRFC